MKQPRPMLLQVDTNHVSVNDGIQTNFKWNVYNKPRLLDGGYEVGGEQGRLMFLPIKTESEKNDTSDIQTMRLFALSIVRDLFRNTSVVDQKVPHEVNVDIPNDIKEFVIKNLDHVSDLVTRELIYQSDPLKPVKSKFESLSLIKKV